MQTGPIIRSTLLTLRSEQAPPSNKCRISKCSFFEKPEHKPTVVKLKHTE